MHRDGDGLAKVQIFRKFHAGPFRQGIAGFEVGNVGVLLQDDADGPGGGVDAVRRLAFYGEGREVSRNQRVVQVIGEFTGSHSQQQ